MPRLAMVVAAALATLALAATPVAAKAPRLKLSAKSAVPGQVLVAQAKGVSLKRARAKVGGKRAELVSRSKRRAKFVVPDLEPRTVKVVLTARGRRLSSRLRIGKGFDGVIKPKLDQARTVSGEIGRAGGEITATAVNGTRFTLSVPADALVATTTLP